MKLGPWEKTVGRALKSLLALPQGDPIGFLRRRRRNNAKIDSKKTTGRKATTLRLGWPPRLKQGSRWPRRRQWSIPYPSRSKPLIPAHSSEDGCLENVALPFVKIISLCCGPISLIKQQALSPIYSASQAIPKFVIQPQARW